MLPVLNPVVTAVSPSSVLQGSASIVLNISGRNFEPGITTVTFGDRELDATVTENLIEAPAPDDAFETTGTVSGVVDSLGKTASFSITVLDGSPAATVFVDANTLTFDLPAGTAAGDHDITVTNDVTSNSVTITVTRPPPTVSSVRPDSGVEGTPHDVDIVGGNFVAGAEVLVDGQPSGGKFGGPTSMSVTLDSAPAGTRSISVRNPDGTESNAVDFTDIPEPVRVPRIRSVSPGPSDIKAGDTVTIIADGLIRGTQVFHSDTDVGIADESCGRPVDHNDPDRNEFYSRFNRNARRWPGDFGNRDQRGVRQLDHVERDDQHRLGTLRWLHLQGDDGQRSERHGRVHDRERQGDRHVGRTELGDPGCDRSRHDYREPVHRRDVGQHQCRDRPCPSTVNSNTEISAVLQLNASAGAKFVSVTNAAGSSGTVTFTINSSAITSATSLVISSLAGSQGFGTEDGTGSAAAFNTPNGSAVYNGSIYVADFVNHTIRRIVISSGVVTTIAGKAGESGSADDASGGDDARFNGPTGIASDGSETLFITDQLNHTIRKIVFSSGVAASVSTLAGTALQSGTDDGTGSAARFNLPFGISCCGGSPSALYIADSGNHSIREVVVSSGVVTTPVGSVAGTSGFVNDDDNAARFNTPKGLVEASPTSAVRQVW